MIMKIQPNPLPFLQNQPLRHHPVLKQPSYEKRNLKKLLDGHNHKSAFPKSHRTLFFQSFFHHAKNDPSLTKSLNEIKVEADANPTFYTPLLQIVLGYQNTSFELLKMANGSLIKIPGFFVRKILLQCLCYLAIKKLQNAPSLTTVQEKNLPSHLQNYYKNFETDILPAIVDWKIHPNPGETSFSTLTLGSYDPNSNTLSTSENNPLPSLCNSEELAFLYHELFHAYQDFLQIRLPGSMIEAEAHLLCRISVLRVKGITSKNDHAKFESLIEKKAKKIQKQNDFSAQDLLEFPKWDWAYAVMSQELTEKEKQAWLVKVATIEKESKRFYIAKIYYSKSVNYVQRHQYPFQFMKNSETNFDFAKENFHKTLTHFESLQKEFLSLFAAYDIAPNSLSPHDDFIEACEKLSEKYLTSPEKYADFLKTDTAFQKNLRQYHTLLARHFVYLNILKQLTEYHPQLHKEFETPFFLSPDFEETLENRYYKVSELFSQVFMVPEFNGF